MSYSVETDTATGHKYIVDVKRRRSICSTDGCLSRAQRNTLCAKHLLACARTTENEKLIRKRAAQQNLRVRKRSVLRKKSHIHRWSGPAHNDLPKDKPSASVHHIEDVLCEYQHRLEHNLINASTTFEAQPNVELHGDAESKSSVEYDYTNPLPKPAANHTEHRRVCIATIHLQEGQWLVDVKASLLAYFKNLYKNARQ